MVARVIDLRAFSTIAPDPGDFASPDAFNDELREVSQEYSEVLFRDCRWLAEALLSGPDPVTYLVALDFTGECDAPAPNGTVENWDVLTVWVTVVVSSIAGDGTTTVDRWGPTVLEPGASAAWSVTGSATATIECSIVVEVSLDPPGR